MQDQRPTPATPATGPANDDQPPVAATGPAPVAPAPMTTSPVIPPVAAPPVAATTVARRSGSARLLNVALAGALVLAVAGVAFAVGRFTAPSTVSAGSFPNGGGGQFFRNGQGDPNGQGGQNGQGGRGAFFAGGGITIEGTVESVDATTLTLKTASGQTLQIALDGSTTYHAQSNASASDVTAGGKVLVRLNGRGGFAGGPQSTAGTGGSTATGPTASDITVVP